MSIPRAQRAEKRKRRRRDEGRGDDQEEAPAENFIDNLPDECLAVIFSLLPAPGDRVRCATVSRKWFRLQALMHRSEFKAAAWVPPAQEISRRVAGNEASDWRLGALAIGIDACGVLTKLSVVEALASPPRHVSDMGLFVVAQACGSLRSLSLRNCVKVTDRGIAAVARCCAGALKSLELARAASITDRGLAALAAGCSALESLTLLACSRVTDGSLAAIARQLTRLKSFALAQCPLVTDSGIVSVIVDRTATLQCLKISTMKLGDGVLRAIAFHSREMKLLCLENVCGLSAAGYRYIGEVRGLRALLLDACAEMSDSCFTMLPAISFAGLKKLSLRRCCLITDQSLLALTMQAAELEHLHLEHLSVISYRALAAALSNSCQTLRVLNLSRCEFHRLGPGEEPVPLPSDCPMMRAVRVEECGGISDAFVEWIGAACKGVTSVGFLRMDSVTDRGVTTLMSRLMGFNRISKVNLTGCGRVGNRSVWSVTRECGAGLRRLILNGCGRVTDRGAAVITRRCRKLLELDLGGCSISDEAVEKLVEEDPPELETLSLAGCTRITGRILDLLDEYSWLGLSRLNLSGCSGLIEAEVDFIRIYIDEVEF